MIQSSNKQLQYLVTPKLSNCAIKVGFTLLDMHFFLFTNQNQSPPYYSMRLFHTLREMSYISHDARMQVQRDADIELSKLRTEWNNKVNPLNFVAKHATHKRCVTNLRTGTSSRHFYSHPFSIIFICHETIDQVFACILIMDCAS